MPERPVQAHPAQAQNRYEPDLGLAEGILDDLLLDQDQRCTCRVLGGDMGLYVQLLTRYLRLPMDALLKSVHAAGIDVDHQAVPVFLDASEPARTSRSGSFSRER